MPESGFKIVKQTTLVHLDKEIQIVSEKATRHRQRFFYKFVNDTTNHMIQVADHISNVWVKIYAEVYTVFG